MCRPGNAQFALRENGTVLHSGTAGLSPHGTVPERVRCHRKLRKSLESQLAQIRFVKNHFLFLKNFVGVKDQDVQVGWRGVLLVAEFAIKQEQVDGNVRGAHILLARD